MSRSVRLVSVLVPSVVAFGLWVGAVLASATPAALWLDNLSWTVAAVTAAVLSWTASRRSFAGTSGQVLRVRTAFALGAYALGQLFWDVNVLLGLEGLTFVADLLFVTFGFSLSLGLYQSWLLRPGARRIPGLHLDTTLMTLGLLSLCLALILPHAAHGTWGAVLLMLAIPAALFGAFSLGLVLMLHDPGPVQWGRAVTLGALFLTAGSWMLRNLSLLSGLPSDGSLLNLGLSVGILALGASIGTWSWSRRLGTQSWQAGALVLLPLIGPVAGGLALLVVTSGPSESLLVWVLFSGLTLVLLVVAALRQWSLLRELREVAHQRSRNSELEQTVNQLRRAQDQLVQSAKMAALGQLIAGITHDLNSPLGAIRSSSLLLQTVLKEQAAAEERLARLDDSQREVYQRLCQGLSPEQSFLDSRAERTLKRDLAERFTERGHQDAAGLAHRLVEFGIAHRDELVAALLDQRDPGPVLDAIEAQATAHRLAAVIQQASERASQVVVSLHNFLRTGGEGERVPVAITESIRGVLPLFQHRMKQGLQLVATLDSEALVFAWPEKLSQVWVNLVTNAVQAVSGQGLIEIAVRDEVDAVVVTVQDDGPGVPEAVQARIFDPFFTTKAAGEGTGLGLDVCRRVVAELEGTITLQSQPGRTVFEVRLPRIGA